MSPTPTAAAETSNSVLPIAVPDLAYVSESAGILSQLSANNVGGANDQLIVTQAVTSGPGGTVRFATSDHKVIKALYKNAWWRPCQIRRCTFPAVRCDNWRAHSQPQSDPAVERELMRDEGHRTLAAPVAHGFIAVGLRRSHRGSSGWIGMQGGCLAGALERLHSGCAKSLVTDDADAIDNVLNECGVPLRVDRDRLGDSYEAWVHVVILNNGDDLLTAFGDHKAVLTWRNCD